MGYIPLPCSAAAAGCKLTICKMDTLQNCTNLVKKVRNNHRHTHYHYDSNFKLLSIVLGTVLVMIIVGYLFQRVAKFLKDRRTKRRNQRIENEPLYYEIEENQETEVVQCAVTEVNQRHDEVIELHEVQ